MMCVGDEFFDDEVVDIMMLTPLLQADREIEQFKQEGRILHIHALILVERDGQKKIIIGDGGERLKKIGQEARLDMQKLFGSKIMLNLWVKVRRGWSDDERALGSLGYRFDD